MMEDKIKNYIQYMKDKYSICGAMLTGSYVTGKMSEHSDIDIFLIWDDDKKSMRGREFFQGTEFEYFISPEWKYIDRLDKDTTSIAIYSSAKILYDENGKLNKIQKMAIEKLKNYKNNFSDDNKKDLLFFIETILTDGEDMYNKKEYNDFLFFTGSNLQKLCNIICKLENKLPIYNKYGVTEISQIDSKFGGILEKYLVTDYLNSDKKKLWIEMCCYVQKKIGDFDIKDYKSVEMLQVY